MRKQLDKQFLEWQKVKKFSEPLEGWIKLIRSALGMTTYQLARRLGINQSRIIKMEAAAKNHTIKLETLARVAGAMDCELVFAFVPKTSLKNTIECQAKAIAEKEVNYISHSMHLENQAVNEHELQEEIDERIQQLLNGPANRLWEDE